MLSAHRQDLYDELQRRFPELEEEFRENADSAYLQVHELGYWLDGFAPEAIPDDVTARVASFWEWAQARAQDPSDHIPSVVFVGFIEKLFRAPGTRQLLPHLMTEQDLIRGASYLKQWVGEEDYYEAWALFIRASGPQDP